MTPLFIPIFVFEVFFLLKHKKLNPFLFENVFWGSLLSLLLLLCSPLLYKFLSLAFFFTFYIKGFAELYLIDSSSFFCFFKKPKSFFSSFCTKKIFSQIITLIAAIAFKHFFLDKTKSLQLLNEPTVLIFILSISVIFYFKQSKSKNNPTKINWDLSDEIHSQIDSKFPLFRKTFKFSGDKTANITIKNSKPHVILVFLESFRSENIGCLNAKIGASPHFDRWAKHGILYENFYATGPQTFRAIISTFFGIIPSLNSPSLNQYKNISFYGLPQIFKKNGYENVIIQSSDLGFDHLQSFFLSKGWDTIIGAEIFGKQTSKISSWGVDDKFCFNEALKQIKNATCPQFISLFTINNHHPWIAPKNWQIDTPNDLSKLQKNFLQTFSYTDFCFGNFLDELYAHNEFKDCVIIALGDHGQLLDERGNFSEIAFDISEKTLKVPCLILNDSTFKTPQKKSQLASQVDIVPTLLDLMNWQEFHHSIGKSLLRDSNKPIFFSTPETIPKFGCIENFIKSIFDGKKTVQFEVSKDPEEQTLLLNKEPRQIQCENIFKNLQSLFVQNKLCPSTLNNIQATFEARSNNSPQDFIQAINNSQPFIDVLLSKCPKITDKSFFFITPNKARHWRKIDLSNLLITDATLDFIGNHCFELNHIELSSCHLISHTGVIQLLTKCPNIHTFILENVHLYLKDSPIVKDWNFSELNLKDCPFISRDWIKSFCQNSPNLQLLKLCLKEFSQDLFSDFIKNTKKLKHLELYQGESFKTPDLQFFLDAQDHLTILHLEDFPLIDNLNFSNLIYLRSLTLINLPKISLDSINFESNKNLKILEIQNCPNLCRKKIEQIALNKSFILKFL